MRKTERDAVYKKKRKKMYLPTDGPRSCWSETERQREHNGEVQVGNIRHTHTHAHTHIHTHTHMHARTHTHIHTHAQAKRNNNNDTNNHNNEKMGGQSLPWMHWLSPLDRQTCSTAVRWADGSAVSCRIAPHRTTADNKPNVWPQNCTRFSFTVQSTYNKYVSAFKVHIIICEWVSKYI